MSGFSTGRINRRQMFRGIGVGALGVIGAYAAGCSASPAAPAAPTAAATKAVAPAAPVAPSSGATKIVLSVDGDAKTEQPVIKALVKMFNESQSRVQVENKPFPEGGYTKAVAMLQAGDAPDITRFDDDDAYFVSTSGKLNDFTDRINQDITNRDDYFAYFFQELAANGKLYCISMCDSVWLWIYNKKLFTDAGITAPKSWKDAWDWDTAVANFKKLAKKQGDITAVYGGMVGHGEEMPYKAGVGHYNHDMTRANFDHPRVVEAMRITAELQYKDKVCVPPGGGNMLDLFNANQLASMIGVQTNAVSISPDIEWDFMPAEKTKVYAYGAPFSRNFGAPTSGPAKNPDAVWAFFKWYLTSEDAQSSTASGGWGIPPLKKIAASKAFTDNTWAKGRNYNVLIEGLDYAYPRSQAPFTPAMAKYWKGGKQRDDVMLGQLSPEEFCKQAQQAVQSEMDKALKAGWKYVPPPSAGKDNSGTVWNRWYYQGDVRADDPRVVGGLAKDDPAV